MLSRIKEVLQKFPYVVTGVLFACALFITIFNEEAYIPAGLFWQILAVSFLCVLGDLFFPQRDMTGRERRVRRLLHYLYINVVVFGSGRIFHWYDAGNLIMNAFMFLMIIVICYSVSFVIQRRNRRLSELLNERLEHYQNKMQ